MPHLGTLNWIAAALLGLGAALAILNLLLGRARVPSLILAGLFSWGLWGLFGLPGSQAPFAVLAVGAAASGLGCALGRGSMASASGLILCLLCLAGIWLLLGFPFLAAALVLVHVCGIGWLLVRGAQAPAPQAGAARLDLAGPILAGALAGLAIVGVLAGGGIEGAIDPAALALRESQAGATVAGGGQLGHLLFGQHHFSEETAMGPSGLRSTVQFRHLPAVLAAALLVLTVLIGLPILGRAPRGAMETRE